MPGLRFPREMAVFGTHDFKLVPSTLWWLIACDPLWFMASRRHYNWTACFPHQLPIVIVSALPTLSRMSVKIVKEGTGVLGRGWRRKPVPSLTCFSPRARHLVLLSASVGWAFLLRGPAWAFPYPEAEFTQVLWDPWSGWCGKKKTFQWLLSTWQWSYAHLSTELAMPDSSESQVHTMPCSWITVLKQIFISMHLIYTFFSFPLSPLAT